MQWEVYLKRGFAFPFYQHFYLHMQYNTIQYFIDNSPWGLFSDNAIKRSNNSKQKD